MTTLAKPSTRNSRRNPEQNPGSKTYQAVAEAVGTLRQYQDVPLRFQRQWITAFLAIMVLVSIVAGLYLNVVSRTAITGREIQGLQSDIIASQRTNADLQTNIAILLSSDSLESRALAAGYVPLQITDLEYIVVSGYYPQEGITLASPAPETVDLSLSPEFSESLSSWLANQIEAASLPLIQEH